MYSVSAFGYSFENQVGTVAATASDRQLQPVYRLFNQRNDHFYTTSDFEASVAVLNGYVREGIAFYCAANLNDCGACTPFYRYVIGSEHFYTTNIVEGFSVVLKGGKYEGIMCYIW